MGSLLKTSRMYQVLIGGAFLWMAFASNSALCQVKTSTPKAPELDCYEWRNKIQGEYREGHYAIVDSLCREYLKSSCLKSDPNAQSIITFFKEFKLEDGYQLGALRELDRMMKSLQDSNKSEPKAIVARIPYLAWRVTMGASIDLASGFRRPGWTRGFMIGRHSRNEEWPFGIDAGLFEQRVPFDFEAVNNRDNNYHYFPGGYVFNASGYATFYKIPLLFSLNDEPSEAGHFGVGFSIGAQVLKLKSVHISTFYYESNYTDVYDPATGTHRLTYDTDPRSDYQDNSFFKKHPRLMLLGNLNIYYKLSKTLMLTGTIQYNKNVSNKFSVAEVDYTKRYNSWPLGISLSYLFGKSTYPQPGYKTIK